MSDSKKQLQKPKLQYDARTGKWTQSYNGEMKRIGGAECADSRRMCVANG